MWLCCGFCVFFLLSLFLVLFPLNGQLLVWKVVRPEILLQFCKRRDPERWGEGLRQVTVTTATVKLLIFSSDVQKNVYIPSSLNVYEWGQEPAHWTQGHLSLSTERSEKKVTQTFCFGRCWCFWGNPVLGLWLGNESQKPCPWSADWKSARQSGAPISLISWVNFKVLWTLPISTYCHHIVFVNLPLENRFV